MKKVIEWFDDLNLRRGTLRRYGLCVTTDRIIGVKHGLDELDGILRKMMQVTGVDNIKELSEDDARKFIELVEQNKDFEVNKSELEEVRVQKRIGKFKRILTWWGDLTIKTARGEYTIGIVDDKVMGTRITELVQILKNLFAVFDESKFALNIGDLKVGRESMKPIVRVLLIILIVEGIAMFLAGIVMSIISFRLGISPIIGPGLALTGLVVMVVGIWLLRRRGKGLLGSGGG